MRAVHAVLALSITVAFLAGCKKDAAPQAPAHAPGAATSAKAPSDAPRSEGGRPIVWQTDFQAGLDAAKAEGKPVMVDFYADWCHWCDKLDEETYTDAEVQALAESFISVKVDADKEQALARQYDASGLPTIVFLSADGAEIHRVRGFRSASEFVPEMKQALGQ